MSMSAPVDPDGVMAAPAGVGETPHMDAATPARPHDDSGGNDGLMARLPAIVWEADGPDPVRMVVSARVRDLTGHDPDAWSAAPGFWADHLHADDRPRVIAAIRRAVREGGRALRTRYRFQAADGTWRWFQDSLTVTVAGDGAVRLAGLMLDVTEDQGELEAIAAGRAAVQAVESRSGSLHAAIVDGLDDGVYYVDRERRINYWNHGAERLTGYRTEEVVGRQCSDNLLCHVDAEGNNLCTRQCPLAATMVDGQSRTIIVWLRHADGSRRPVQTRTAPIRDPDGSIVGGVEIFNDATGLIEAQDAAEAARRDALTDPLTGLPNRRLLDPVLAARRDDLGRAGRPYGLLIADVDRFKSINDRYGHDVGDEALRVVASTLRGGVRGGDTLVRWGGEEFAIVAAVTDALALHRLADRLLALMRAAAFRVDGEAVPVRISLGGAIARAGEDAEHLFARADHALLAAKEAGRDRCVVAEEVEVLEVAAPEGGAATDAFDAAPQVASPLPAAEGSAA
jgi:diguanylate cyclase (GGDEF)-like protein/PAS domain S-box-containing protein